jgi:hypothetical protein
VCERETDKHERECVCEREQVCERETESVCVRERDRAISPISQNIYTISLDDIFYCSTRNRMMSLLILLILLVTLSLTEGLIHHLTIHNDHRNMFKIESFGFLQGGTMQLDVSDFHVKPPSIPTTKAQGKKKYSNKEKELIVDEMDNIRRLDNSNINLAHYNVGFILRHAHSESAAQQDLERIIDRNECIFDKKRSNDIFVDMSDPSNWKKLSFVHQVDSEAEIGFYTLIFAHCNVKRSPDASTTGVIDKTGASDLTSHFAKSFSLEVVFQNPGPDYLSAGDTPLPIMYLVFFLIFSVAMALWMYVLSKGGRHQSTSFATPVVHKIHLLMLALLTVKVLTLLFESIRYHYIATYGVSEGWSLVYYFFATLKGIMLFTVILLIGSGYSLMKNYLNANEKKVIYAVLILQVVDNIAMVVLEETAPGSETWLTWKDILHLVDILCCIAILLPIIWSIKHLRYRLFSFD